MKGQGGGGTAKGGGKNRGGGGSVKISKTKDRQTKAVEASILKLRQALFDESGKDKNVLNGIAESFQSFDRNGISIQITFSPSLSEEQLDWAFNLCRDNMEAKYDASGYGWDDEDKERELSEAGARFLLLRDKKTGNLQGFAHFRFTVQGEVIDKMAGEPCLFLGDLHIEEPFQRKGLGKHVMVLLELIARREGMTRVSFPVYLNDSDGKSWASKLRGFSCDSSYKAVGFDSDAEGFEVYSKVFSPVIAPKPAAASETLPVVTNSASINSVAAPAAAAAASNASSSAETVFTDRLAAVTANLSNATITTKDGQVTVEDASDDDSEGEGEGEVVDNGWVKI